MEPKKIFQEAKQINIVELLAALGFTPAKTSRGDYWYLSPFRNERTASFKVHREGKKWFDFGEGIGGNIIDFAMKFFQCDAKDAAQKLLGVSRKSDFSFHPPHIPLAAAGEKKEQAGAGITILATRLLQNKPLVGYIEESKIPLDISQQFCREVDFLLNGTAQFAVGFENRSGGFELRNSLFKGSSSPKDVTFFDNNCSQVCVFEGFFDFLSFAALRPHIASELSNCLVLNSLSYFEKSRSLIEQHKRIFLFLDQGKAGRQSTQKALGWDKEIKQSRYADCSAFYQRHEDLNAWFVAQSRQQGQQMRKPGIRP